MFSYEKFIGLVVANNTSCYKVGKITNISPTVFSDWKSGKSKPKADKVIRLAEHFGVSMEYFLE